MATDRRTSAQPITVNGVIFRCYDLGMLQYEWRSEGGRFTAARRPMRETFHASVDGIGLPTRFRSLESAMRSAIKAAKASAPLSGDRMGAPASDAIA